MQGKRQEGNQYQKVPEGAMVNLAARVEQSKRNAERWLLEQEAASVVGGVGETTMGEIRNALGIEDDDEVPS